MTKPTTLNPNPTAPATNGPPSETPKKVRQPPDEFRAMRLIAGLLERLDEPARLRLCHYLSSYFTAQVKPKEATP